MFIVVPINYEVPLDFLIFPILVFISVFLVIIVMKIKIFIEERKEKKNDK